MGSLPRIPMKVNLGRVLPYIIPYIAPFKEFGL